MRRRRKRVLLASGFGEDTGGGLFALDGSKVERLDELSTTGLAVSDGRLARALQGPTEPGYGAELVVYDERGVERYLRLDDGHDPHDLLWDGNVFVLASPSSNRVLWFSGAGELVDSWDAPGEGDAWHLNGLLDVEGDLHVMAFGRFGAHRQWAGENTDGTGFVMNLRTGEDVISGLWCPHNPRLVDGSWLACNSGGRELLQLSRDGEVERRLQLASWTRGLAIDERHVYVGESAPRRASTGETTRAHVVTVSREDWQVVSRVELPCREVYDLALVPAEVAEGVRRGFRTNPLRAAEQDQHALFRRAGVRPARLWASGDPIPAEGRRARVEADVPSELRPEQLVELECVVHNLGSAIFVSAPPNPVHISYRWFPGNGDGPIEGPRALLPAALPPGEEELCRLGLKAPADPGRYMLRLTLVQEEIAWFDDPDERNAHVQEVEVRG